MRTIKLCAAPTRRPTTLRLAIARSVAEIEKSGRPPRPIGVPVARTALA